MTRTIAIAAALAAVMTTFVAQARDAPLDGGKVMAEALSAAKKNAPVAEKKKESRKAAPRKAASTVKRRSRGAAPATASLPPVALDRTTTASIGAKAGTKDVAASKTLASASPYDSIIDRYDREHGIAPALARAVIAVESGHRANITGSAGEVGLMQIKPSTARMLGYSGSIKQLYHPETNIKWGTKYLGMAQQVGNGTTCGTLLKYNAGHAAKRMNPVSAAYCGRVKARLADAT